MDALSPHPVDALTQFGTALTEGRKQSWLGSTRTPWRRAIIWEPWSILIGAFPVIGPPLNAAMNEMRKPEGGPAAGRDPPGIDWSGHGARGGKPCPVRRTGFRRGCGNRAGAREAIQAVKARIPDVTPTVKSRLNPVQQNAVDYLQSQDVPLNVGTVTGNRFAKGAQALVAQTPLGSGVASGATQATEQGLSRLSGELAEQAHPEPVTPESAGAAVSSRLDQNIAALKARAKTKRTAMRGRAQTIRNMRRVFRCVQDQKPHARRERQAHRDDAERTGDAERADAGGCARYQSPACPGDGADVMDASRGSGIKRGPTRR